MVHSCQASPTLFSAKKLRKKTNQDSFISILRGGELVLNKRFTFRDIFTIYGYLLSDVQGNKDNLDNCKFVKNLNWKQVSKNYLKLIKL